MSQVLAEKKLLVTYSLCTVLGAVASITTGIAWGHWKLTLDQCVNGKNCSCILYGQHTPSKFLGGSAAPCIWVTFGPLFYVLFTIAMTCFHGYRVIFSSRSVKTRTVMSKNEVGETVETRVVQIDDTARLPRAFWATLAVLTSIWTVYALVHFAIFLDGFYHTCNQYRRTLEVLLGVHGTAIPVIHGRLSCQSIFDFMDYMQPSSGYGYRDGFIYTGADLIIGILASCFAWILLAFASFVNIKRAKLQE
ncbi:uncharacterized protein LOC123014140 [Tribolium madens]|uniref:uncharacterized protein LOC123014140 n=1 Tax=Tribolium madens TaxID=41895 RepID=UPI001CF723C5|nr:uncharacterized protein LOC123014140 [Tribolium madens]XP_044268993.1 uncharacterized protein LOC123014140 [Tribolium madens]